MEKDRFIRLGVGVIVVFLVGVFLKLARPVLVPFFLALFLSFALSPVLDFLVRKKIPKAVALVGILLLTFIFLYLVGALFFSSGKTLAAELPSYDDMIKSFMEGVDQTVRDERLRTEIMGWVSGLNAQKVGGLILSTLGPFISFLSELLFVFIFTIFILAGRGRMEKKMARAFSPEQASTVARELRKIDHQIQRYLAVKTLVSLLTGLLTMVVLMAFRVPFAVVFGVLTFLLNFIPNLGSVIAAALPVLLAAFYFGSLGPAIGILILLMAIHMTIGNGIEPRLMGKGLGMSPLLVFFSLFFGAWLWGIPGMILSVPMLAVFKIIFSNIPSLRVLEAMMS
jgi:AI-2 transport protein TqsA